MAKLFEKREEIETWLITQPGEVVSVFAARAALRAIPYFFSLINNKNFKGRPEDIILPSLWSIATALAAGNWPAKAVEIRSAAYAAASAASAAAAAASAAADADAADADAAYAAARNTFFTEYFWDKEFIDSGGFANELSQQSLWSDILKPEPRSQVAQIITQWGELKRYLLSLDQDWDVWTEWYDGRLRSDEAHKSLPLIEEIELGLDPENGQYGRVTFPPRRL